MNRLARHTIAWTVFYGILAAAIIISDHIAPDVLYLNL